MRIAVASQNLLTVTGHAGKTRSFIVYEAQSGQIPEQIGRLQLPAEQTIHNWSADAPHPLDSMDAIIVGSAGANFVAAMTRRGVETVITDATDPAAAVVAFMAGTLDRLPPHDH
ncbi:NifB/NifX family molybdenum-iron cluster-binding protein [Magnetospirillum aberrantis]|uniref:Nitrogen fixation protein n=1 Tax=Magnetospirillum aberrantis SpK TaxID=908842 RepID=A0A7C9QRV5_9PROT|nr:nitrogen fixation protein [Magnetospirillum aberrantis]NFV78757.1 nitrogen fixation protein [Magnetospirillum aberrantis SpK]